MEEVCRICHLSHDYGKLIQPCMCKGTARFVHEKCLYKWRKAIGERASNCEICRFTYRVTKTYPSFFQYMIEHWSISEKITYASAFASTIFSLVMSFQKFRTERKQIVIKKRHSNQVVALIDIVFNGMYYGWPQPYRSFMILCTFLLVTGNWLLFQIWREEHKNERVLPYYPTEKKV